MSNENKDLLNEVFAGDAMSVVNLDENSAGADKVAADETASEVASTPVTVKDVSKKVEVPTGVEPQKTVIGASTIISGDITSGDILEIEGKVTGNISGDLAVSVGSEVIGDVTGDSVRVSAKIRGNVEGVTTVTIEEGSVVTGNISGNQVYIHGAVKGNISAEDSISLAATGVVVGDIEAGSVSMDPGAIIKGNFAVKGETDPDMTIFD